MKQLLLTSTALLMTAGAAFAQTSTGGGIPDNATAESGVTASGDVNAPSYPQSGAGGGNEDAASYADLNGFTDAIVNGTSAYNGNSYTAGAYNSNGESVDVNPNSANANLQFQVGNNNQSVNLQSGTFQESATLQSGDDHMAIISQTSSANEAAISQLGDMHNSAIFQQGNDNAGASAQIGTDNMSVMLQMGNDNTAAHSQMGTSNMALTFQNDGGNIAAQVQAGTENKSFISQGGGISSGITAIDGTPLTVSLAQVGVGTVGGTVVGPASMNSAASVQVGTGNLSGIIQQGTGNEAVNYQSSP